MTRQNTTLQERQPRCSSDGFSAHETWLEIQSARLFWYSLFQRTFALEPDEEYIRHFEGELFSEALDIVCDPCDRKEAALFRVAAASWARQVSSASASEYTRLFIGPGAPVAPPWESQYHSKNKSLFQRNTLEVRQVYQQLRLRLDSAYKVADDHLAIELDCMKKSCEAIVCAGVAGDQSHTEHLCSAQNQFLNDHLLRWVDHFAERVIADTRAVFYSVGAQALTHFLRLDAHILRR